jgi:hypothetical protein
MPGMERLIRTNWKDDAANVAAVTAEKFRQFVLEIKREVKNGPKVGRGRATLPTHEYIQTITRALEGKAHMYSSELNERGTWWIDDYHPVHNPTGCPPWVLAAVVISACVDGIRHVVSKSHAVRQVVEENRQKSAAATAAEKTEKRPSDVRSAQKTPGARIKKVTAPRIFSVARERISFPPNFLSMMNKIMASSVPVPKGLLALKENRDRGSHDGEEVSPASSQEAARDAAIVSNAPVYWTELDEDTKDKVTLECLLRNLRGLTTLVNYVAKARCIPEWLVSYIQLFANAISIGKFGIGLTEAIETFSSAQSLATWMQNFSLAKKISETVEEARPEKKTKRRRTAPAVDISGNSAPSCAPRSEEEEEEQAASVAPDAGSSSVAPSPPSSLVEWKKTFDSGKCANVFPEIFQRSMLTPPGISVETARDILGLTEMFLTLSAPIRDILRGLAVLPEETAQCLLDQISTAEGRRRCADQNFLLNLQSSCPREDGEDVSVIVEICKLIATIVS